MEDLKIIQLYWEREESAIIKTKEKYGKTMEQLAYRLLFDYQDTEECCSDTYWDLWNALPPNRPIHFKAFIMRICRCNAMNRLERREAKKRTGVLPRRSSSQWAAMILLREAAFRMAVRIMSSLCTPFPSSVKAITFSASASKSASSFPREPFVIQP